jgi:acyl-ACP thioesterase
MNKFEKVGKFQFVTESYLLDFRGRLTIPMIGNYLLHAASSHASQRGFGFSDMTEKQTAWVLSRLVMEINRYPGMSESVTLYTWIEEVGRFLTTRCFELTDSTGVSLGYARSVWAAIDLQTRRPTPLDIEALQVHVSSERSCPIEKPGKIAPFEGETTGVPYQVKYSDLDINGHLNSIKYMEHLLDLFEPDLFKIKEVRRFEIAYLSEGWYGMPLVLHKKEMEPDTYYMAISHESRVICRAIANWGQSERT